MDIKEEIERLKHLNKLCEVMMRLPHVTHDEKGKYGREIISNNQKIKELKKKLYERVY